MNLTLNSLIHITYQEKYYFSQIAYPAKANICNIANIMIKSDVFFICDKSFLSNKKFPEYNT